MERTTIAIVSDVHAGSTVAVCPAEVPLDDGGTYRADGKAQTWLRQCWGNAWDRVAERHKANGGRLGILCNGDLVDGDHHGTGQIISRLAGAEREAARLLWDTPLALSPDWLWFVRGTESHVGKNAGAEESFAKGLKADGQPVQGDPSTGTLSWWHLRLEIHGHQISAAHHGRIGRRPWTRKQNVDYLARHIAAEYTDRGERPPDLNIRSHYHTYVDTGPRHPNKPGTTRVVQTPAWQLHTGYAHKVVTEELSDIGLVILSIDPHGIEIEPVLFTPERAPVWTP